MHNEPLHHRKTVSLPMAKTILNQYLEARKENLPVVQSKRWAVYAGESIRFGRGIPYTYPKTGRWKNHPIPIYKYERREKSVWFRGISKHAKEEIFDRLMKNTLGTTRFTGKPKTVESWMLSALKRHDRKVWTDLMQAAKNYKNIVGVRPSPTDRRFLTIYRQWLKILRGRNLFLRGFGKFDITEAVKRLGEQYASDYIHGPIDITASGYGFNRWLFQMLIKNPVLRKYYLQHRTFWQANKNRLDELFQSTLIIPWIEDDPDILPETLLGRLAAERERYYAVDNSPEPFAHLAEAPSIETPCGTLRHIATSEKPAGSEGGWIGDEKLRHQLHLPDSQKVHFATGPI